MPGGERIIQYQPGAERQRFLRPRATETDLRLTEQLLGVPLPPLLSRVYLTLANGGFGPGYGLLGAPGVPLLDANPDPNGDYGLFHIDGEHGQFHRDDSLKGAIPLCDWGCWIRSVLDPDSGCVLRRYLDDEVEATSLSEWLEAWAASDEPPALWEFTPVSSPSCHV
jgi:hypothetical protein